MLPILRALKNVCPRCGRAPLFRGIFELHETCPSCSARHERMVGSWTIASWICASIGIIVGGVMAVMLYSDAGYSVAMEAMIIGVSALVALITYRPVKAVTFGALHMVGMGHPDPVQIGNVIFMERYKARRAGERDAEEAPERQVEGG